MCDGRRCLLYRSLHIFSLNIDIISSLFIFFIFWTLRENKNKINWVWMSLRFAFTFIFNYTLWNFFFFVWEKQVEWNSKIDKKTKTCFAWNSLFVCSEKKSLLEFLLHFWCVLTCSLNNYSSFVSTWFQNYFYLIHKNYN